MNVKNLSREELEAIASTAMQLAYQVDTLNPLCLSIGPGRMEAMRELSTKLLSDINNGKANAK